MWMGIAHMHDEAPELCKLICPHWSTIITVLCWSASCTSLFPYTTEWGQRINLRVHLISWHNITWAYVHASTNGIELWLLSCTNGQGVGGSKLVLCSTHGTRHWGGVGVGGLYMYAVVVLYLPFLTTCHVFESHQGTILLFTNHLLKRMWQGM